MTRRRTTDNGRAQLITFGDKLGCLETALGRDECNAWRIVGKHGHVSATRHSFHLYVKGKSARAWSAAKAAMKSFAGVFADGDDEGVLMLDHLPTEAEAATIRSKLGIKKRREMVGEELVRHRGWASSNRGS